MTSSSGAVDRELVARKLQQLEGYLRELEQAAPGDYQSYAADIVTKRAVERLLQLCIECASDINAHLLAKSVGVAPADYYMSFIMAGDRGLIPAELAGELAPSAGLRNKLVHEYGVVDDRLVYESVSNTALLFPRYIRAIKNYLEGASSSHS